MAAKSVQQNDNGEVKHKADVRAARRMKQRRYKAQSRTPLHTVQRLQAERAKRP
jgi:hypothetical protein